MLIIAQNQTVTLGPDNLALNVLIDVLILEHNSILRLGIPVFTQQFVNQGGTLLFLGQDGLYHNGDGGFLHIVPNLNVMGANEQVD